MFQKGENPNHPKKGQSIKAEPIRTIEEIEYVKSILARKPRDYALFILGINTNLRAIDLLDIKIGQVKNLQPGDEISLMERKTKKNRRITLNRSCIAAIKPLIPNPCPEEYDGIHLFRTLKNKPLSVAYFSSLVKIWFIRAGHSGKGKSAHTLRKTFASVQYNHFKTPVAVIQHMMNHSSERQTLEYISFQPETIKSVYMNEI